LRNMRSDSSVLLTEFGSGLVVGNIPSCCMSFPWRDLSIRSFGWYEMSCASQAGRLANRLFYLSIPPDIFVDVARCASHSATSLRGWTRVIVEKPFGRDSQSSAELTRGLKQHLKEEQIYRWGILDEFTLKFPCLQPWYLSVNYLSKGACMNFDMHSYYLPVGWINLSFLQNWPLSGQRIGGELISFAVLKPGVWAIMVTPVYS
jgi:hypothetical protein